MPSIYSMNNKPTCAKCHVVFPSEYGDPSPDPPTKIEEVLFQASSPPSGKVSLGSILSVFKHVWREH